MSRSFNYRLFALFVQIPLILLGIAGCQSTKTEPGPDTGATVKRLSDLAKKKTGETTESTENLTPEQLREKTLKQIKDQQEKANKAREEMAKKKSAPRDTHRKREDSKPGMLAVTKAGEHVIELDRNQKKDKKDKKEDGARVVQLNRESAENGDVSDLPGKAKAARSGSIVDLTASGASKGSAAVAMKNGTAASFLQNPKNKKMQTKPLDTWETAERAPLSEHVSGPSVLDEMAKAGTLPGREPPKKSFFGKLFGKDQANKKKREPVVTDKSGNIELPNPNSKVSPPPMSSPAFSRSSPDSKRSLMERVQAEMAAKRLQQQAGKIAESSKAEVVPIPGEAVSPTPAAITAKSPFDPPEKARTVESDLNDADAKAFAEETYWAGLKSKDSVTREASFRRAVVEKREDAIPFLLEEVKENRLLAVFALQCLAQIGKKTDAVEAALVAGLANKDAQVRQACGETIGLLRCKRALQPMIELLKIEKSYPCRGTYVDAFGFLGERSAIPVLKAKLEEPGEIQFVKSCAALSLARLGDPSGRAHLIAMLDSPARELQVLGLRGLAQLNDPDCANYLSSGLDSPDEEVWVAAVFLFPQLGPALAMPLLQQRLESTSEVVRRRAALSMGFLGSQDAVPYIEQSVRYGTLQERVIGCELLANLERRDKIPLLIEKLHDPQSSVRETAAVALTRMNAVEAIPAITDAVRGTSMKQPLPPGLRSAGPDMAEKLILVSCLRILRNEREDFVMEVLPDGRYRNWPELDRNISQQQVELVKLYELVDVVTAAKKPVGAILKGPNGREVLYREGEPVAGGFVVRDISTGTDKQKFPPYVTLIRGAERVTLVTGRPAEFNAPRNEKRK